MAGANCWVDQDLHVKQSTIKQQKATMPTADQLLKTRTRVKMNVKPKDQPVKAAL